MSSVPTSFYDIRQNDYVHHSYMAPIDSRFDTGYGESFYPLSLNEVLAPAFPKPNNALYNQCPDGGLYPAFPTYNTVPHFQTPPSFTRTPSSSSGSSTSLEPSPNLLLGDSPRLYSELEGSLAQPTAAPPAKNERVVSVPRTRGPNKRPPGTGYADLVENLPLEVQTALNQLYPGCCDAVNNQDNSTWQKHVFSNRHTSKLEKHHQELLPSFVCPAFIALHAECKTAKAGRYDSTERHCKSCSGFEKISKKHNLFPVQVTKAEHRAIQAFRTNTQHDEETVRHVENTLSKMLVMMIEAGMTLEPVSDDSDAMDVTDSP